MKRILGNEVLDVALIVAVWNDGQDKLAANMAADWIRLAQSRTTRKRRTSAVFDLARATTYQAARAEMRLPGSEFIVD